MFKSSFDNFDVSRAMLFDAPARERLEVATTQPIKDLLAQNIIRRDQDAMMMLIGGTPLSFLAAHVIHHGVIQGETNGQPWMIAMCKVCNGAGCFSPEVNGEIHHFSTYGLYNSMSLIGDDETQTYWDHIAGVGLYGALKGYQLKTITSLLHMTVGQIAALYPRAEFIYSTLTPDQKNIADQDNDFRKNDNRETPAQYLNTLGQEDMRLARLDMGLGIWSIDVQRYYPLTILHGNERKLFDTFAGRKIVIYVDPNSHFPSAFYSEADAGEWQDADLMLNNGHVLREGVLLDEHGTQLDMERPFQLFQRWFGFSFSFPGCDIYAK